MPHESAMVVFQCHEQVFAGWVYFSTVFSVRVCDHEPDVDSVSEFFASAESSALPAMPLTVPSAEALAETAVDHSSVRDQALWGVVVVV